MTSQVKKINQSIILYDDCFMKEIDENIFETDFDLMFIKKTENKLHRIRRPKEIRT